MENHRGPTPIELKDNPSVLPKSRDMVVLY